MPRSATALRPQRPAIAAEEAPREHRRRSRDARRLAQRDPVVRAGHRRLRTGLWHYFWRSDMPTVLSAPVIYSVALPFLLLDLWVTVYQAVCFRAWGVARVRRRSFFAIDRHKLAYLNAFEKVNCLFCSYATGLIAYVGEVAARTEQYWCPIRHARRTRHPHERYAAFTEYGDARAYHRGLAGIRAALRR